MSVCRSAGLGDGSGPRFVPGPEQDAVLSGRHQGPAEVDGRGDGGRGRGRGRTPSAPAAGEDEAGPDSVQNHRPDHTFAFQTLSSELDALAAALTRQRSKFSGLSCAPPCLDDAFRVLSVIRASLSFREKRLGELKRENVHQVRTRLPWIRAEGMAG